VELATIKPGGDGIVGIEGGSGTVDGVGEKVVLSEECRIKIDGRVGDDGSV